MTLTDEDGLAVDWVVVEHESDLGPTTFMTYGRVPAVEVSVPSGYSLTAASGLLLDLADAVSRTEVQRSCL